MDIMLCGWVSYVFCYSCLDKNVVFGPFGQMMQHNQLTLYIIKKFGSVNIIKCVYVFTVCKY